MDCIRWNILSCGMIICTSWQEHRFSVRLFRRRAAINHQHAFTRTTLPHRQLIGFRCSQRRSPGLNTWIVCLKYQVHRSEFILFYVRFTGEFVHAWCGPGWIEHRVKITFSTDGAIRWHVCLGWLYVPTHISAWLHISMYASATIRMPVHHCVYMCTYVYGCTSEHP